MSKDITPEIFKKYFETRKLGRLIVNIPECGITSLDLTLLYRHGTGLKFFEYQTSPENIEAIAVYGSVLFNHFPPKKTIKTKKRWFSDPVQVEVVEPRKMPNDFDVMIITKEGFNDEKVIVPKRKYREEPSDTPSATEAVETKQRHGTTYGYYDVIVGTNLHITYRSSQQFLAGLGNGDTLSESVVRYGVPIFGQGRFEDIVQNVVSPKREPLHMVEWGEDLEGMLQGEILSRVE